MKLKDILQNVKLSAPVDESLLNSDIKAIKLDSRKIEKGDLFAAIDGARTSGTRFIDEALSLGAAVAVRAAKGNFRADNRVLLVDDINKTFAFICKNYYKNPTKNIKLFGVTGTNGKTTITYILESIFSIEEKIGVIGTINYRYGGKVIPALHTTPFANDLMRMISEMVIAGISTTVMETSSHSLAQSRVDCCEFDCAVFSNLTQDHLDYHKTMENYFAAKSRLFTELLPQSIKKNKYAIVNADDEWGKRIINNIPKCVETVKCSLRRSADVYIKESAMSAQKTRFICSIFGKSDEFETNLIGEYNLYNALLAIALSSRMGVSLGNIKKGLASIPMIPGRLETLHSKKGFTVVIDYAHTPDALIKVLTALRDLADKKIITVFGCGGERDRTKRPLMGAAVSTLSDFVIVTSDNPRTEDPLKIILDTEIGIRKAGAVNYKIIPDRKEAIKYALDLAKTGDVVLLAGKGHEAYQIIGEDKIPFSDYSAAREIIDKDNG